MWNLNQFQDNQAIIDESGNSLTYEQLYRESEELYDVIGGRCLVFCLCTNRVGSVLGYVSFVEHDVVPVLLNSQLEKELLSTLLNTYHPSYIWIPTEQKDDFISCSMIYEKYGYVLLKTDFKKRYPLYKELCLLLTTSGSTGSPKLVRQSYRNVKSNADSIIQYLKIDATERPITTLPMNYTYGLSIINSHLMVGATILVTDKGLMQKEFWNFLRENSATSFGGVPYTYEMLERLRFFRMELPSLRYLTQAGGKLTLELHKKFAGYAVEKKKKFIVMYGQCEATARMGYLPAEKALDKAGSMGIAIPGGKFYLIDASHKEIDEPNITGELVYEGPNVTLGYAECGEDLIKGDERGGILKTGDMALFDEEGYYYIVGRKKRFLKIYGNRVNLDEIVKPQIISGDFRRLFQTET
ncbi:MAG: AMP-binding protein, partial [Acetivibrio ethanolgignens]